MASASSAPPATSPVANQNGAKRWANHTCSKCGQPIRRTQSHSSMPPPMQHFDCRYPPSQPQLELRTR